MKVAFYKHNKHLFNRLVAWWTKGAYSHIELVLSDEKTTDGYLCASSSNRDRGVRYKRINLNNGHWDVFQLAGFDEQAAKDYINARLYAQYDIKGLFGFVWGASKDNRRKEFCSELVMGALGFSEPWRFNPNDCYAILKQVVYGKT